MLTGDDVKLAYTMAAILREKPTKVVRKLDAIRHPDKVKTDRKAANVRKQRYRQRLRRDVQVLTVEVPRIPFAEALIESGRITPEASLFREQIEEATTRLLADWSARWK
jgi:hypothetical protein